MLALSSQIAALEAENVGVKDWATKGEAKARDRPVNSLLEEDLEYERSGKVVPVITEETTKTIEDLIKKRILDVSNFDFGRNSSKMADVFFSRSIESIR